MLSFIVFSGAALISVIFLLGLTIKHSANSYVSWLGSVMMIFSAFIAIMGNEGIWNSISIAGFGTGLALYLAGLYLLTERSLSKSNVSGNNIQSKTIGDILEVAASRESLMELLNYSLDRFLEIFSLNSGAIHIFHARKNKLIMGSYRGLIPSHAKRMEILEPGQTAIGRAVQNQRVLIIRDLSVSPDYGFFGGKSEGYTFLAVAPIMVDDKCWGVITLMGRQKYQKGIFTIDQLEQYGQKLGKALVLGRENRRMSAAYNHLTHVIEYYNSLFAYLKDSSMTADEWNDRELFATLQHYKDQLFDSKTFAVIKYSDNSAECLFVQNQNQAVPPGFNRYPEKISGAGTPESFLSGEYFNVYPNELREIFKFNTFKNIKLAAYGFQFSDDFKGLVVVDDCKLNEMPTYSESVLLIGNLLSLSYVRYRFDYRFSEDEMRVEKPRTDEVGIDKVDDLSFILKEITGNIKMLNEKTINLEQAEQVDSIKQWLDEIEESALNGLKLLGRSENNNNPNDLIQSVIDEQKLDVAFYPGLHLPRMKINPDQFKQVVKQVISEAVSENKRIRIKTSSADNGAISLTIEGPVKSDFPSASTILNSRIKNILLNVVREEEIEIAENIDSVTEDIQVKLNVLTIEDKPVITDLLDVYLGKLGCNNHTVSTGERGLVYLESQLMDDRKLDVVIIDMTLEDISGLELCRKIKQINDTVYVILISSWGVNLNKFTLDDAGVDVLLQKPFSFEQLQKVLPSREITDAT